MDGFDCLGTDDDVGFDPGALLQAAGGVAQYGVSAYEQEKKEQESSAEQSRKLSDVIAADGAASLAVAKADVSAQAKSASMTIDAQAAQMALDAQDRAGMGLSLDTAKKRAESADRNLATAVKNAQARPLDRYLAALVKAWTATANKAHSTAIASSDSGLKSLGAESWFTKRVAGPVPGWGVLAIGTAALTAVGVVIKKFVFKR